MLNVGYIVYGIVVLWTVIMLFAMRSWIARGVGAPRRMINAVMLFIVSLVVVPALSLSPLHLLWMLPTSFFLGMLSTAFPFSLLSIPGHVVFRIVCIGLDMEKAEEAQKKREYDEKLHSVLFKLGIEMSLSAKQAKALAEQTAARGQERGD